MKIKNMKIVSILLALCMLPLHNAAAYTDNEIYEQGKTFDDFSTENNLELSSISIYDTDLVLSEEEIKHGAAMPSEGESESDDIDELDFDNSYLPDEEFNIESLIKEQALYADEAPKKYIDSSQVDIEKRIPAVYDEESKEKLRKLIMGGSDRVRYFADWMTFGITPIYAPTSSTVGHAFDEAAWQNQMILEEDILDIKKDPAIYEDENGNTYYRYDIEYQVSNPTLRKKYQLEMYDKAQKIIDEIGMYTNGRYVEELYEINNYIIDHGVYSYDIVRNKVTHTMQRKAYGILVEGRGICSAYARAFQFVARMAGFVCVVDGGRATLSINRLTGEIKTGPHAWNMVYMDADKWLMVDPTFNDDHEDGFSASRNSYLMIPKNASSRNRVSDGRCFAKRGIFTNIEQPIDDFSYDYMDYMGQSAKDVDTAIKRLCEYINKGFVPRYFRFQWDVSEEELSQISNEVYEKVRLKLKINTTGYDAYLATLSVLKNDTGKELKTTNKGLYEIRLKNGKYIESKYIYPDYVYTRGRKATDSNASNENTGNNVNNNSSSGSSSSSGGTGNKNKGIWMQDTKGWWYKNKDGSYPKNEWKEIEEQWYVFDSEGYMITGWHYINANWYYLSQSGAMLTGWLESAGKWYYLEATGKEGKPKGAMYADELTMDGYKVGADGAWTGAD